MSDSRHIIFLRHAETNFNVKGIIQGWSCDSVLTGKGVRDANKLGHLIIGKFGIPELLVSSTLKRSIQTAEILRKKFNAKILSDSRLNEISRGIWEGKMNYEDPRWKKFLEKARKLGDAKVGKGESYKEMFARVENFYLKIKKEGFDSSLTVIISHGITMNVLKFLFSGNVPKKWCDIESSDKNCQKNEFEFFAGKQKFKAHFL